ERRIVDRRLFLRVDRLHEIDFDLERSATGHRDVLVDVLALALERSGYGKTECVDPQAAKPALVEATDGDLLNAENTERAVAHETLPFRLLRMLSTCQTAETGTVPVFRRRARKQPGLSRFCCRDARRRIGGS